MHSGTNSSVFHPGWQFLQIPGPSNVPRAVLEAIGRPTIDHRGDEFARLAIDLISDLRHLFGTSDTVVALPSSGTGAWEAALVNVASPGDHVVMAETGYFSNLWHKLAEALGLKAEILPGNWRRAADPQSIHERLRADPSHGIKAVCVVHNETSTGATSDIAAIRQAIDEAGHPALLMVDTISSLGSMPYEHDRWGVDVTVSGSQKGLMLPPGLGFNAFGSKARAAMKAARLPRAYFDWEAMEQVGTTGQFPYTPATNLLFGLRAALDQLKAEGLENVFARHARHARAARAAVSAWGLDILCEQPEARSSVLTAVSMPGGRSADALRAHIMRRFNMPLGNGLGQLKDKVFRIGHLGHFNDLMLIGALGGVQLGLVENGLQIKSSGVDAALDELADADGLAGAA